MEDRYVEAATNMARTVERVRIALDRLMEAQADLDRASVVLESLRSEESLTRIVAQIDARR